MAIKWIKFDELFKQKLESENFLKQVAAHGYFAELFPSCFSSINFSEKLDLLLPYIHFANNQLNKANKNSTSPTTLSTRKNDVSRRVLSLPNPKAFLRVAKLMEENWESIKLFTNSTNSLSPITYLHDYENGEKELLNSENIREYYHSKSDFIDGVKNCIIISLGYKYRLKVDIANCYNSLYTHSIAWAICGKQEAKKYMRTKEPESLKEKYELADKLDAFVRFQKNNETNGIVVGPFTSRIFSEIILSAIDTELRNKNFIFKRYVDDYKFYFQSEARAQESVAIIERLLNEFGLNLNTSKTDITKYPFEVISQMKESYESARKQEGVFGVLNSASQLYLKGEKGAYKYALKFIQNIKPKNKDARVILSMLVNILLIEPKYGKYVIAYLKKYMYSGEITLELINNELFKSIDNHQQQETLVFLQIIRELKIKLKADNLIAILSSDNDFAIIMALDIWKSRPQHIERTRAQKTEIKNSIKKLIEDLKGEDYSGSRWFLLYESQVHGLLDNNLLPELPEDSFFEIMKVNHISFFKAIGRKFY